MLAFIGMSETAQRAVAICSEGRRVYGRGNCHIRTSRTSILSNHICIINSTSHCLKHYGQQLRKNATMEERVECPGLMCRMKGAPSGLGTDLHDAGDDPSIKEFFDVKGWENDVILG